MQRKDFTPKRLGFIKCCIHTRHGASLASISLHVSVDGQIVVRTCLSGSLKYHKYQDIESEVEEYMENGWQKLVMSWAYNADKKGRL